MQLAGWWQSQAPSADRLSSSAPFSIDTLSFLEWLQWIYIARLRAIIEAEGRLPSGADVYAYAEEALKEKGTEALSLLDLIRRLDGLLNGNS